jgi:hypothetical protein
MKRTHPGTVQHEQPRKNGRTVHQPLRRSKYQIFPAHPSDCRAALKTSIGDQGVEKATTWDDQGNLLDGWERETACEEYGRSCPSEVRHFTNEAAKFQFILAVNAHRRPTLNRAQKREVIAGYLKGDPGIADNTLGQTLGVSKNTVLAVRRRLEEGRQIRKVRRTRGRDGKLRPVRYTKRIITNTLKEFDKAKEIIRDLPDNCAGKTLDIVTAKRRAATNGTKAERESRTIGPLGDDAIRLFHCRFQDLERTAGISPGSVNLLLTDIPYGQAFLSQVPELATFAERILAEGGLFVCLCGQYWLHKVMEAVNQFLTYR